MYQTVVLLNILVETVMHFFQDSLMNKKFKRTAFIFCNIINVFTITFETFNVSLLNKSKIFQKWILTPNFWTVVHVPE